MYLIIDQGEEPGGTTKGGDFEPIRLRHFTRVNLVKVPRCLSFLRSRTVVGIAYVSAVLLHRREILNTDRFEI